MAASKLWAGIIGALNGHLDTMTGVPVVDGVKQIAWKNAKFKPNVGTMYLTSTLLPAATIAASIGVDGTDRPGGLYRVQIFAPANKGTFDVMELADIVTEHFARGVTLDYNGIRVHLTTSEISPGIPTNVPESSEVYFAVGVDINWFSYGEV